MTWLLMNPAKVPAVWQAIWQHTPRAKDNVVPLARRTKAH
jgi:hypothetical protein